MHPGIFIGVFLFAAAVLLLKRAFENMHAMEKARSRSPFGEKLLRPAGESLRIRIDGLAEQMAEVCLVLTFSLVIPSIVMIGVNPFKNGVNLGVWLSAAAAGYGTAYKQWKKLRQLREQLRNCRLGFDGERYVATELEPLLAKGYRVFHDLVFDMRPGGDRTTFNIDHIAVGPEGVFAIETKTRRKRLDTGGNTPIHEVAFDGKLLRFPGGFATDEPITQAKQNAEALSKWLTGSAPERVEVRPLLVIPGWMIKTADWKTSGVQSAKKIAQRIPGLGRGRRLSENEVRMIADRIEAQCRNLEGA
jgi:hypothetical protein